MPVIPSTLYPLDTGYLPVDAYALADDSVKRKLSISKGGGLLAYKLFEP